MSCAFGAYLRLAICIGARRRYLLCMVFRDTTLDESEHRRGGADLFGFDVWMVEVRDSCLESGIEEKELEFCDRRLGCDPVPIESMLNFASDSHDIIASIFP